MDEQYFNSPEDSRIKQNVDWETLWGAQHIADYCWQASEIQPSTSLQALPWLQRCSHPHLNPKDFLKLMMNLSTVGGNGIWVSVIHQCQQFYSSVAEVRSHGEDGLLLPHGTSLLFSLQRHGRYQGKDMKYSEKAFKSKLNPINDSFKRSIPYIYKSTLMGLCTIWLLTFAVSQNTVQATWALTSSLETPQCEAFWRGKFFSSEFWFKLHTEPAKNPAPSREASFVSATL